MSNYDDLFENSPFAEAPASGVPPVQQYSKEEYAEVKRVEREEVFALSDATALKVAGDGEEFRAFLDLQSRLLRYSETNALLIYAQNPNASRLGSFDHWKNLNCFVKPGQTAMSILEPREYAREDGTAGTAFNVKKVFDISQVDTRRLQDTPQPAYTERQLLGALVSNAPVAIKSVDELPHELGARYDPQTDSISVLKGMSFGDIFRSLTQELALSELTAGPDVQKDPSFSAYCAAYLLCKQREVDCGGFDFDFAPEIFEDMSALEVKGELSRIRDTAGSISGRMARELPAQSRPAITQDAR